MTLNADQEAVAQDVFGFLLSDTQKEMALSGPAGVGKTYLLQNIIKKILPEYKTACQLLGTKPTIDKVVLTATTNKAAEVLSTNTGILALTIHSALNLTVVPNFETGIDKLIKTKLFRVHHNTLFIIDEASMVDSNLYTILHGGTDSSCKLLYVGDHCQLAPVGERLSRVFSPNIPTAHLTKPVRNADQPALMDLCQQLRETVETGVFKPIKAVPGAIFYPTDAEMEALVQHTFKQEGANSRILAHTNKKVQEYNSYIRSIRGYTSEFNVGERLVNNSAVELGQRGTLAAEAEVIVHQISPDMEEIEIDDAKVDAYQIVVEVAKGGHLLTFYQPKSRDYLNTLIAHFKRQKKWIHYYSIKNKFPDLRARDSSTVYKAQGSTFDTVFIDIENLGTTNVANQAARLLYVAVSRARLGVYLYGRLPAKYGG